MGKKIIVHGKVQGVFYRHNTQLKAKELGVNGTVENLKDGTVQIFAESDSEILDQFIEWTKIGPSAADVEKIEVYDFSFETKPEYFKILR